jgi:hypothetical protein
VAVIDQQQRAELGGQRCELVHRRQDAVHTEHAVGDDQHGARLAAPGLELAAQVRHVGVFVGVLLRLAQADAVDQAGVDQAVGDDHVLGPQQHFENGRVGVEARGEQHGRGPAEELGQLALQLAVRAMRAADEAHGRHAVAALLQAALRRSDNFRMVSQAQVIVGAEVKHAAGQGARRVLDIDLHPLRAVQEALRLEQALVTDGVELGAQALLQVGGVHMLIVRATTCS